MVNLENKLTVDDLIVEYMIYKVKNGYEPSFLTSEFMSFLYFFESKMEVHDSLYNNEALFQRFFKRKNEHDWSCGKGIYSDEKVIEPHMNMVYSKKDNDYLIKANYKLSEYDRSVINTYFMPGGPWGEGKAKEIRNIIGEYLTDYPKRTIDEGTDVYDYQMTVGKYIAAEIIINTGEKCMKEQKYNYKLTKEFQDKLVELYNILYKRVAILYSEDRNLKISTYSNGYLARANYDLLIQNCEIIDKTLKFNKKALTIDLEKMKIEEIQQIGVLYDLDDEYDIKSTEYFIGNDKAKKLSKSLERLKLIKHC